MQAINLKSQSKLLLISLERESNIDTKVDQDTTEFVTV